MLSIFQSIASVYTGLMQGVGAAEKVFEYLDRKPKHPADGSEAPDTCMGVVEFKDVTFAYPTRPEIDILKVCSERSCFFLSVLSVDKPSTMKTLFT